MKEDNTYNGKLEEDVSVSLQQRESNKKALKRRRIKPIGSDEVITKSAQAFLTAIRETPFKKEMRLKPLPAIGSGLDSAVQNDVSNRRRNDKIGCKSDADSAVDKLSELEQIFSSSFGKTARSKNCEILSGKDNTEAINFNNSLTEEGTSFENIETPKTKHGISVLTRGNVCNDEEDLPPEEKYVPMFSQRADKYIDASVRLSSEKSFINDNSCPIIVTASSPMFTRAKPIGFKNTDAVRRKRSTRRLNDNDIDNPASSTLSDGESFLTTKDSGSFYRPCPLQRVRRNRSQEKCFPKFNLSPPSSPSRGNNDNKKTPYNNNGQTTKRNSIYKSRIPASKFDAGKETLSPLLQKVESDSLYNQLTCVNSSANLSPKNLCLPGRRARLPRRCGCNKYLPPLSENTTTTKSKNDEAIS